jgi:hypothetical protein
VLGRPIAHSLSPSLHRAAYAALGLDWRYDAVDVGEPELPGFLDALGSEWAGLSLTMPLKTAVLPLLDEVSALARDVAAANTVLLRDGRRHGDNTDVPGIVAALAEGRHHDGRPRRGARRRSDRALGPRRPGSPGLPDAGAGGPLVAGPHAGGRRAAGGGAERRPVVAGGAGRLRPARQHAARRRSGPPRAPRRRRAACSTSSTTPGRPRWQPAAAGWWSAARRCCCTRPPSRCG